MKKIILSSLILAMMLATVGIVIAGVNKNGERTAKVCATIQDGTIKYGKVGGPDTEVIPLGYDRWGYNYQAHMFNGWYHNSPRPNPAYTDEQSLIDAGKSTTWLMMKWSDEWLSNKDCNGDGKLDRGYSCNPENPTNSACQGAWLTNHQFGEYINEETGKTCKWNYFVKMVMVPEDARKESGMWYTDETMETEIGPVIWGAYAKTLQISNDPCADEHGVLYHSEAPVGFGYYN